MMGRRLVDLSGMTGNVGAGVMTPEYLDRCRGATGHAYGRLLLAFSRELIPVMRNRRDDGLDDLVIDRHLLAAQGDQEIAVKADAVLVDGL